MRFFELSLTECGIIVAKRKTLFDDRPVEIAELTYIIKQDLSSLNSQISALQSLSRSQHPQSRSSSGDQEGEHNKNVRRSSVWLYLVLTGVRSWFCFRANWPMYLSTSRTSSKSALRTFKPPGQEQKTLSPLFRHTRNLLWTINNLHHLCTTPLPKVEHPNRATRTTRIRTSSL